MFNVIMVPRNLSDISIETLERDAQKIGELIVTLPNRIAHSQLLFPLQAGKKTRFSNVKTFQEVHVHYPCHIIFDTLNQKNYNHEFLLLLQKI